MRKPTVIPIAIVAGVTYWLLPSDEWRLARERAGAPLLHLQANRTWCEFLLQGQVDKVRNLRLHAHPKTDNQSLTSQFIWLRVESIDLLGHGKGQDWLSANGQLVELGEPRHPPPRPLSFEVEYNHSLDLATIRFYSAS